MARPQYHRQNQRQNGVDLSPMLPLMVLVVAAFMILSPSFQMMPAFVEGTHQMFSFTWVVPLIVVAAIFLTSSEILAPTYPYNRRVAAYSSFSRYAGNPNRSYYGGESPSWGLIGLMLVMLLLLPWRY